MTEAEQAERVSSGCPHLAKLDCTTTPRNDSPSSLIQSVSELHKFGLDVDGGGRQT